MKAKLSVLMLFLASRDAIALLPPSPSSSSPSSSSSMQPPRRSERSRTTRLPIFSLPHHLRKCRRNGVGTLRYTTRPEIEDTTTKDDGASNFWYTVSRRNPPSDPKVRTSRIATPTLSISASNPSAPLAAAVAAEDALPCVPTLDLEGPLPPGAYVTTTKTTIEDSTDGDAKPTCRISVALSSLRREGGSGGGDDFDVSLQVRGMQRFIDSGLTSFQLPHRPEDDNTSPAKEYRLDAVLYRQLQRDTPRSVLNRIKVTVPIALSQIQSARAARTVVMDLLMQYRTDALDDVQLVFRNNEDDNANRVNTDGSPRGSNRDRFERGGSSSRNPRRRYRSDLFPSDVLRKGHEYMLDALDALRDLQREGYVRSVSTRNLPPDAQWLAEQCGFVEAISSNVADGSLLWRPGSPGQVVRQVQTQEDYDATLRIPSKFLPTILSSPLAGGLLTDRYLNCPSPGQLSNASGREQQRRIKILQEYAMRHRADEFESSSLSEAAAWREYQTALDAIHQISRGYVGSDVASVSLRWLLQQQQLRAPTSGDQHGADSLRNIPIVGGVVVATSFYDPNKQDDAQKQIARRIKSLRSVFTFQVSNDEMKQLNDLSGWGAILKSRDATKDRSTKEFRFM
jgi:Aldo/keto reductase family